MKKKINCTLLVDDDMVSNFISERFIRSLNIADDVKMAPNGEVALKYIEDCISAGEHVCPELIFLDINMPVMDAFDFLTLYRNMSDKNKGKIVILTTSNHPNDIDKLATLGITDFINKPLTSEKLMTLMKKHFDWAE